MTVCDGSDVVLMTMTGSVLMAAPAGWRDRVWLLIATAEPSAAGRRNDLISLAQSPPGRVEKL